MRMFLKSAQTVGVIHVPFFTGYNDSIGTEPVFNGVYHEKLYQRVRFGRS